MEVWRLLLMDAFDQDKIFYTITEVSKMLAVEPYVLRFWEREFPSIAPTKQARGKRLYRKEDIAIIKAIQELLYKQGYTIKGANKFLTKACIREIQEAALSAELDFSAPILPSLSSAVDSEDSSLSDYNKELVAKALKQTVEIEKLI